MSYFHRSLQARYGDPVATMKAAHERYTIVADYFVRETGLPDGLKIEMMALPADAIPLNVTLQTQPCDAAGNSTLALRVGYMSGDYLSDEADRTVGSEFFTNNTVARDGGTVDTPFTVPLLALPSAHDRVIGIEVVSPASQPVVGAQIRLLLDCVSKPRGIRSTIGEV